MTPERWQQIERIFQDAIDLSPDQRSAFLNQVCGDDLELRQEVESLLLPESTSIRPIAAVISEAVGLLPESNEKDWVGQHVGPYRITGIIGQGGMGIVYRAVRDDDEYRKQVALKVVRQGMDSRHILSRFRKERQILAGLDHPNIARLLDGGTTEDGLPYFVMEYIQGFPVTQYCESERIGIAERLKLFQQICSAVQYAHQKLVIHRDLKPGNILVARDGTPKLLDFGIAKLLNPDTDSAKATETMTILRLMTPDYASPEQVRGLEVSTSTDVYSLGAVLYELLTGQRPHQFKNYTPTEIERVICLAETERPSSAIRRSTGVPAKISKLLTGDLDNIILKAMRKEPERRYQSAGQFGEDVGRYLQGLPVIARSDTFVYRAGKFVRRHKLGVVAILIVILSLVGGITAALYQARKAERRFEQVRKLANTFLFDFHDSIKDLPGATPAREMVVHTALEYLDSLAGESEGDPSLQWELAEAYQKVGDVQGDPRGMNLGKPADAMTSYRKALTLTQKLTASDPTNTPALRSLAISYYKVGDLQVEMGDITGGSETLMSGVPVAEELYKKHPENQKDILLLIRTLRLLGDAQLKARHPAAALQTQKRALVLTEDMAKRFKDDLSQHHLCLTYIRVGEAQAETGDIYGSIQSYSKVRDIRKKLVEKHPLDAIYKREWRLVHTWLGNYAGGLDTFNLGDQKAAKAYYEKALEIAEENANSDSKNATFQHDLALCNSKMGDVFSESDPLKSIGFYVKSMEINDRLLKASPTEFRFLSRQALFLRSLAVPLSKVGDRKGAIENLEQAVETLELMLTMSPDNAEAHAGMHATRLILGDTFLEKQNFPAALENYRAAFRIAETSLANSPTDLYAMWRLAATYSGLGKYFAAMASQPKTSSAIQAENWKNAIASYGKSYEIWKDWDRHAVSSPFNTSRRDLAAKEILHCKTELAKLETNPS